MLIWLPPRLVSRAVIRQFGRGFGRVVAMVAGLSLSVTGALVHTNVQVRAQTAPQFVGTIYNGGGIAPLAPNATATASDGTVYASDESGLRIVKVDPTSGAITQVSAASLGWSHPSGMVLEPDQMHLWVADKDHSRIVRIDTATGSFIRTIGGAGLLLNPEDLAIDRGLTGIYVNDTYHHRVVGLQYATGSVKWTTTTCAGTGILRNRGIVFGTDGNLYVTDTDNGRVVVIDPATGNCLRSFGTRGSKPGQLSEPRGISSDNQGGLWIAENNNFRVQHLMQSGAFLGATTTTFGSGTNQFRTPHGVEFVNGQILVSDTYSYRVAVYNQNPDGSASLDHYLAFPAPAAGGFNGPLYVAYDPSGNLYVVDHFNMRVEKFDPSLSFVSQFGGAGTPAGSLTFPRGIAVSSDGSQILVCDSENHRIQFFSPSSGAVLRKPLTPAGMSLQRPYQIALGLDGSVWIADTNNHRVLDVGMSGVVLHSWASASNMSPRGIAVDLEGFVYVADTANSVVQKFNASGTLVATLATPGTGATQVRSAAGLAITGAPGAETLFIADTNNDRVLEMTTSGAPILALGGSGAGDGQLIHPQAVAVGPTGQIAVADYGNNRIEVWQA